MSSNNTLKWAARKRTFAELALGLVDRACDEAKSQKKDWVDVCDALLSVASNFVEWEVMNPDEILTVRNLLSGLRQLMNRHSDLRKGGYEIPKERSILPLMEWLNNFLTGHSREIVREQNIPVGNRPYDPVPPGAYRVPQSLEKVTKDLARLKKTL